jgi:glycosyltransferase involved in cell wall biosynthesis
MISNKSLLYIGETSGVHDKRFLKAFCLKFNVTTLFLSDTNQKELEVQKKFDIIVVSPISYDLLKLSKGYEGTKIGICWAIEVNHLNYNREQIEFIQNNLKEFKAVIADADYIASQIREKFLFKGRVIKLYYGCDLNQFLQPQNHITGKNENRICVTRRWLPLYNNELIIKAVTILEKTHKVQLVFTNNKESEPDESQISLISTLKTKTKFVQANSAEEVANIFSYSDIYLSASQSDGISVSLLEAMASGLICVVTNFPTNLEIIKHGINGFIFKNNDIESLVSTLDEVFSLPEQEQLQIIQRAQQFVKGAADWHRNKMELLDTLLEIIHED